MRIVPEICLLLILLSVHAKTQDIFIGVLSDHSHNDWHDEGIFMQEDLKEFLEKNGAQVSVIFFDDDDSFIEEQLLYVSGIIFPTSDLFIDDQREEDLHIYLKKAKEIYNYAKEQQLPVLGISEGFEVIFTIESGKEMEKNLLQGKKTISWVPQWIQDQRILSKGQTVDFITETGIKKDVFKSIPSMNNHFQITSVSEREAADNSDVETVASFQSKDFPIVAVQFEPQNPQNNASNFIRNFIHDAREWNENKYS